MLVMVVLTVWNYWLGSHSLACLCVWGKRPRQIDFLWFAVSCLFFVWGSSCVYILSQNTWMTFYSHYLISHLTFS